MNQPLIYIVDDDRPLSRLIETYLKKYFVTKTFERAEQAISEMATDKPSILLLDIELPGINGLTAIQKIKRKSPETVIMMLTGNNDISIVVEAIKNGASEYIVKPIEPKSLLTKINKEIKNIGIKKELCQMQEIFLKEKFPYITGESEQISEVMAVVKKVSQSKRTSVLISGETGTGKELIASTIHYRSAQTEGPFVPLNCAIIQESLFESELFGYVKGAFSGASASGKSGLVEIAKNGTLFLDEVSELSLNSQAKLLRFLDSGEYYKVGGTQKCKARLRIISASNKNIEEMIEKEEFREDLYYRLAVVKISVPALNKRRDDIIPIANHFLEEFNRTLSKDKKFFSNQAKQALESFCWRGNVRELRNCVERAVLISNKQEIQPQDLGIVNDTPKMMKKHNNDALPELSSSGIDLNKLLNSIEMNYFKSALDITRGNETKAAKILNMSRDKFRYRRLKLFK